MKIKILKELVNHLTSQGNAMNKERLDITVRLDYKTVDAKKNFIAFSIGANVFKNNSPGALFMNEHDYFENHRDMAKFFIENVLNKQVKIQTNKPFSKYVISLAELNDIQSANLHKFLGEELATKDQKTLTRKI